MQDSGSPDPFHRALMFGRKHPPVTPQKGLRMKKALYAALLFLASSSASAAPVRWELVDFQFSDAATAYGSFTYDSDTETFHDIDIRTTDGPTQAGRHYVSTAGTWGMHAPQGTLAFSDSTGPDFTDAGWFRMDIYVHFNASPGTIATQWFPASAESFCMNESCWTAASEDIAPGKSRRLTAGYLIAAAPVPEPAPFVLGTAGLLVIAARLASRQRRI